MSTMYLIAFLDQFFFRYFAWSININSYEKVSHFIFIKDTSHAFSEFLDS